MNKRQQFQHECRQELSKRKDGAGCHIEVNEYGAPEAQWAVRLFPPGSSRPNVDGSSGTMNPRPFMFVKTSNPDPVAVVDELLRKRAMVLND